MKIEELHKFTQADWQLLETQFAGFSCPIIDFVTENKGSVSEAEDIYINAFIYYTQLLELHGLKLVPKAQDLIYSFSRKLWIKVLGKRNVDVNFVMHRRSFYEMEDAFEEIESINERSDKTAQKLAEIGEPARTLILDNIGRNLELEIVGARLGYATEEKAFVQIAKSLRKLISLSEAKTFELSDTEFECLVRYVLDNNQGNPVDFPEENKVAITMISRSVAMVRNYITRNERIAKLKEMQERIHPDVHSSIEKKALPDTTKKSRKMKPAAVFILSGVVALSVSVLTAFGITNLNKPTENKAPEPISIVDSAVVILQQPRIEHEIKITHSAFPISNDGLFITTAKVAKGEKLKLQGTDVTEYLTGEVVYADTTQGIALIKCALEQTLKLPYMLALKDPKIAQELYAVGYLDKDFFYTEGKVNVAGNDGVGKVKLSNVSSGSPLVSESGQILGMIIDSSSQEEINSVLHCSKIKDAIAEYEANSGLKVRLITRNGLFYSNRMSQVEKLKPYIYQVINI